MAPEFEDPVPYPLYNTTFTLHRLSPLYIGDNSPLNDATLAQHAKRFRERLVGDVMRGVRVGLGSENDPVSTAGKLIAVIWRILPVEEAWRGTDEEDVTLSLAPGRGIRLVVEYERNIYSAILLRDTTTDEEEPVDNANGFEHYPLLLMKMPVSLREAFVDFLSETFDTRVSKLPLSSKYISDVFENYITNVSTTEDGEQLAWEERSASIRGIIKDAEVFIGFDLPGSSGALKTMEIHLMREDLPRLVSRGKVIGTKSTENSPFMEALSTYVKAHLALDMKHESVRIVRIACGAFVLGGEGKIKLTLPAGSEDRESHHTRATASLIDSLVKKAAERRLHQDSR